MRPVAKVYCFVGLGTEGSDVMLAGVPCFCFYYSLVVDYVSFVASPHPSPSVRIEMIRPLLKRPSVAG